MPFQVLMPALSPTMTEGTLMKWHVAVGDTVDSGDVIAEIETDKATMEVEAVDAGKVAKLLVDEGTENVAVNKLIAVLLEEGESPESLVALLEAKDAPASETTVGTKAEPTDASPTTASTPPPATMPTHATQDRDSRVFASPLARRLAKDGGIDLVALQGSGPHGRIVKRDVEVAIENGIVAPEPASPMPSTSGSHTAPSPTMPIENAFEPEFELLKLNTMRKVIARRLLESKQTIPHFYLARDIILDALLTLRKNLNDKANGQFKLSVNDLIIKAAALALVKVPAANAAWSDSGIKLYKQADISVAVAIEGGLITPVIRAAETKGLATISSDMRALAEKARAGHLKPEEYQGGTFSISNLGMYGINSFQAVINPPQACILAVGAGEKRAVVEADSVTVKTVMTVNLSVDHRAVDGAVGAEFLKAFKAIIEDPLSMML